MEIVDNELIQVPFYRNEPDALILREFVRDHAALINTSTVRETLVMAVMRGHINSVRILLEAGISPNSRSEEYGDTVLHIASMFDQNTVIIRELLKYGADVNAADERKTTPLHEVSRFKSIENMQVLLLNGARVNAVDADGNTPLHLSLSPINLTYPDASIVEVLLKAGADVNLSDGFGRAPLHYALEYRSPEIVRLLLRHNADVNVTDNCGNTPLHFTAMDMVEPSKSIRELLKGGARLDSLNNDGHSPLYCAIDARNVEATQELLRYGAAFDIVTCLKSLEGSDSERGRPLYTIPAIACLLIRYNFIKYPHSLQSTRHQKLRQQKVNNILRSIPSPVYNLEGFLQACLSEVEALSKVICDCGKSSVWGSINNSEGCDCNTHQAIFKFLFSGRRTNFTDAFFYKLSKEFLLEATLNLMSYYEFKASKKRLILPWPCMKEIERYVSFEDAVSFLQSKQLEMSASEFQKYVSFIKGDSSYKSSSEIPAPKRLRVS